MHAGLCDSYPLQAIQAVGFLKAQTVLVTQRQCIGKALQLHQADDLALDNIFITAITRHLQNCSNIASKSVSQTKIDIDLRGFIYSDRMH